MVPLRLQAKVFELMRAAVDARWPALSPEAIAYDLLTHHAFQNGEAAPNLKEVEDIVARHN
jgi:hypothetical protein